MLGISHKAKAKKKDSATATASVGGTEFNVCVLDERKATRHLFRMGSVTIDQAQILEGILNSDSLRAAETRHMPSTAVSMCGGGERNCLYVLPYEHKPDEWHYACVQVLVHQPSPNDVLDLSISELVKGQVCFFLVDSCNIVRAANPRIDGPFVAASSALMGAEFSEFFSENDLRRVLLSPADTGISIDDCVFHCLDGSRRDVAIKKFSLPNSFVLYVFFDVSPPKVTTEFEGEGVRERRRIGQDLHDSVGQLMTGMSLLSRSLANRLMNEGNPATSDADQISSLADEASDQIRSISRGLMPSEIVQCGLFDSLHELARTTTESCGIACAAQIDESVVFGDGAVETHLYRIAQEAVNNAVRHANARAIQIIVSREEEVPNLTVLDNGTWKIPSDDLNGIGLKSMAYRAGAIGARLTVGASDTGGTQMVCLMEMEESFATRM